MTLTRGRVPVEFSPCPGWGVGWGVCPALVAAVTAVLSSPSQSSEVQSSEVLPLEQESEFLPTPLVRGRFGMALSAGAGHRWTSHPRRPTTPTLRRGPRERAQGLRLPLEPGHRRPLGIRCTIPDKADRARNRRLRGSRGGRPPCFDPVDHCERHAVECGINCQRPVTVDFPTRGHFVSYNGHFNFPPAATSCTEREVIPGGVRPTTARSEAGR